MEYVTEQFGSIADLLETLNQRENNHVMRHEHSSQKIEEDRDWTGTYDWNEAIELLRDGYIDIVPRIQDEVRKNSKLHLDLGLDRKIENNHMGFIPNVPNALQNLPKSMINIDRPNLKNRVVKITYVWTGACSKSTEYFIKNGIALVSAINIMEAQGLQVKLDVAFFCARSDGTIAAPTVCIKNHGQRFNLTKIAFPIAHPSMFRRIGFKWLETVPNLKADFSCGYGSPESSKEYLTPCFDVDGTKSFLFVIDEIDNNSEDKKVEYILKKMNLI